MYDKTCFFVKWIMKKALLLLLIPVAVSAQDAARRRLSGRYLEVLKQIEAMKKTKQPSASIGDPDHAKLVNTAELSLKGYGYRIANPGRKTNFGTDEMVFGLMILGAEMVEHYGDEGAFYVGDISHEEGGKLNPHLSHQGGREVDLGFFLCDDKQHPQGCRIEEINKDGKAKSGNLRFDLQRNWDFLCLMFDNPIFGEEIKFVILAKWVQDLLAHYAQDRIAKSRNPSERDYLDRHIKLAQRLFMSKDDHDSHFHLRIKVTHEDARLGGRD